MTKPVHRLLFPDRAANPRSFMKSAIFWQSSWSVEQASGEMTKMTAIMGEEIIETGDFIVNEKDKIVNLTEEGVKKVEKFF